MTLILPRRNRFPPQKRGSSGTTNASLTTPYSLNMPTGIQQGELLIAVLRAASGGTITWPAGWTPVDTATNSAIAYRFADGSEGSTISVSSTIGGSQSVRGLITRFSPVAAVEFSTVATGTSTAPNSPSFAPSFGLRDALWLSIAVSLSSTMSATPSGYDSTDLVVGGVMVGSRRERVASIDPGAWTSAGSSAWRAYTVALRS